jgi:Na+-transporting NADH:ubiquinone oxidoreductase subunit NqrA
LEYIVEGRTKSETQLRFVRNSVLTVEGLAGMAQPMDRTFISIITLAEGTEREFMSFLRPGPDRDSYSNVFLSAIFKGLKKKCNTNLHGEGRPCIFCGYCEQACPAGVIPHLLYHYVNKEMIDETLLSYKIFDCIDCNLCSYVCTSKIPLASYIKTGKEKLIEEGLAAPTPGCTLKGVAEQENAE